MTKSKSTKTGAAKVSAAPMDQHERKRRQTALHYACTSPLSETSAAERVTVANAYYDFLRGKEPALKVVVGQPASQEPQAE